MIAALASIIPLLLTPDTSTGERICPGRGINGHLRLFGFYDVIHLNLFESGPTPANYYDDVRCFTNFNQIMEFVGADYAILPTMLDVLESSAGDRNRGMVSVTNVFFYVDWAHQALPYNTWARLALRPDYQQRWSQFADLLTPRMLDNILAFDLSDEPMWNGLTPEELELASDACHQRFPSIPTFFTEAMLPFMEMPQNGLRIPVNVDWLSFDFYGPNVDTVNNVVLPCLQHLETLTDKPILLTAQVFPDGWLTQEARECPLNEQYISNRNHQQVGQTMANILQRYFEIARDDPQVIGIFGYIWPNDDRCLWSGWVYDGNTYGANHYMDTAFGAKVYEIYSQIADACWISSPDCNADGLPDSCDLPTAYVNNTINPQCRSGSWDHPFRDVWQGVNEVGARGRVQVQAGSYPGAVRVARPMTLNAAGGTARIGQ